VKFPQRRDAGAAEGAGCAAGAESASRKPKVVCAVVDVAVS
jgi:hypothetical protein